MGERGQALIELMVVALIVVLLIAVAVLLIAVAWLSVMNRQEAAACEDRGDIWLGREQECVPGFDR